MTLDEAIRHAEEVAEEQEIDIENQDPLFPNNIEECKKCAEEHRQLAEWLKDYKRLLKQEPCDDAVSRKAVINQIFYSTDNSGDVVLGSALRERIARLPSVTPQEPKTGHWIADVDRWGDVVTTVNGYKCDKCNAFNSDKDNYCPNCGAKMVEPQEGEEV